MSKLFQYPLVALAGLVLLVGLCGHPGVTADPPGWFFVAGSALLVVSALRLVVKAQMARSRALGLGLLLAFVGWGALSSLGSLDGFLSRTELAEEAGALGVCLAILVGVESREAWALTVLVLVGATCLSCAFGVAREVQNGGLLISNFTNPDCYSVIPLVGTLLALGLVDRAEGRERYLLVAIIPFLTLCVLLTASRSGLLGLVAGWLIFGWSSRRRPGARMALVIALAAPVLAGLLLLSVGEGDVLTAKWNQLIVRKETVGVQARSDVALYSLQLLRQHPALGTGPGTFHLAYQQVRPPTMGEAYMNEAHNDYVQIVVETGVVGLALWLATMSLSIFYGVRHGADSGLFHYYAAAAAVAAVGVYALGNFALPVPICFTYWLVPLVLALCYRSEPSLPALATRAFGLLLLVVGLAGLWLGGRVAWNNVALARAGRDQDALKWRAALTALQHGTDRTDVRVLLAESANAERLSAFSADGRLLDQAIGCLQTALALSPHNLDVMLRLADLLESRQQYGPSLALLRQARREAPETHEIDLPIARSLVMQGKFDEAAQLLRESGSENAASLGQLLVLIEQLHKGSALERLNALFATSPQLAEQVAVDAARSAVQVGNTVLGEACWRLLLKHNPRARGASYELARLETDPDRRLALVENELKLEADEETTPLVLSMWAALKLQNGTERAVVPRLESYLVKHPRSNTVRLLLSETYVQIGNDTDARRVLRDGLDYDRDGSIAFRLGGLFEKGGDAEIALSYYEDAHRAHPDNAAVTAAIDRLKSNPEALAAPGLKTRPGQKKVTLEEAAGAE